MDDLPSVESPCPVCGGHGVLKAVDTSAAHSTVVLTCSRCGIGFRATVPAGDAKAIQEAQRDLLRHWNRRPANRPATLHHADGEPSDGHSCPFCGSHSVAAESYSLFLDQRIRIACGACGAATRAYPRMIAYSRTVRPDMTRKQGLKSYGNVSSDYDIISQRTKNHCTMV